MWALGEGEARERSRPRTRRLAPAQMCRVGMQVILDTELTRTLPAMPTTATKTRAEGSDSLYLSKTSVYKLYTYKYI